MKRNIYEEEDSYEGLKKFVDFEKGVTEEEKKYFTKELFDRSDKYFKEISKKNKKRRKERLEKSKFIIKYSKYDYDSEDLEEMSMDEIRSIYNKIKERKTSWYKAIIDIILGNNDTKQIDSDR